MSSAAAQLQFAAQLTLFLVALVGLTLSLRPGLLSPSPGARSLMGAGFLAIAVASFLVGAELVTDPGTSALVALRVGGAIAVLVGTVRWRWGGTAQRRDRRSGGAMVAGLVLVVAAGLARIAEAEGLADGLGGLGAFLVGGALFAVSRRSIPARISASAAALVLVVLLAVSLALSVVVTRNVEDEALRRYGSRASSEAAAAVDTAEESLAAANLLSVELARSYGPRLTTLADPATGPGQQQAARTEIERGLPTLTGPDLLGIAETVVVVDAAGGIVATSPPVLDGAIRLSLAVAPPVVEAAAAGGPRQAVSVVGDRAFAVAAVPVVLRPDGAPQQAAGVVTVATPLDATYLRRVNPGGEPLALALATPDGTVAQAGAELPPSALVPVAARVVAGEPVARQIDGRFVAARPVARPGQQAELALVVSVPTSAVDETRADLFRTLFLVALGSALGAVALAALAGSRIGRGVGRLATAAERIRAGDLTATTGVRTEDELGALGRTFDAMAGSLQTMTTDLERVAADEARLRGRLAAVVGSMTEALLAAGRDGRVIECNRSAELLLGRPADQVVGRPLNEVIGLRDADTGERVSLTSSSGTLDAMRAGEAVLATGAGGGGDVVDRRLPVAYSAAAVSEEDGSEAATVVVLRDLRRERQVEDMKTEFLANISHELRTPLTPIRGYAATLGKGTVDRSRTVEFAGQIGAGVTQLERVIDQLVNFATMAAGRLNLHPEPTDGSTMVRDAAARWSARVNGQREVRPFVADGLPPVVVDRRYVDQALDELLDNAVKFSPDGGDIRVAAELADGGAGVRISVTDRGTGLDPARAGELTAAFAQGDGSATRRFGGLGLGLALVDRIARAHGASLGWDSPDPAGSRFSIVFPVGDEPGQASPAPDDQVRSG